jgi:hypothetical protein
VPTELKGRVELILETIATRLEVPEGLRAAGDLPTD